MFNNSALDVNSIGLVMPEANGVVPSPLQLNSGIPISRSSGRSIAFVDAGLSDVKTLVAGLQADTTVYLLDSAGDALSQITAVLGGYHDLASVAIVSHGRDGGLQLGNSWLDSNSLKGQAGLVKSWAGALGKGADLLLYGCDVAADAIGQSFVQQFAALTGADVAASSNLTGSAALGGDWVLEYQTGTIEAAVLAVANYASVLATFNVTNTNNNGAGSLRDAISLANAAPGADTIDFTGSIFKDAVPDQITLTSGELLINSDITIKGTGASKLSISGNNASRVFNITSGKVTISGLLITQGKVTGFASGGGIFNGGTLTLNNSTVSGNTADFGGGIENGGTLTVNNSTVSGNTAVQVGVGGGIRNNGTLTLKSSTVSGNTAGFGGGISNFATLTLNSSTVSGNTATRNGGGIENFIGTLALSNSTISDNTASTGGGIFNDRGTLTLKSSTVSGNSATTRDGGGIANLGGTMTLNYSTVSGNSASFSGGGIENINGTLTLNHSTVSGNRATTGGGIRNFGLNGTLTVNNSTVSGNTAADFGGGILNDLGTLTLKSSTVSGNKAISGGGIYNFGTLALKNSIINGNTATVSGGGLNSGGGTIGLISGTTISGNTAPTNPNTYITN